MNWPKPQENKDNPPKFVFTVLIAGNDAKARSWQQHAARQGQTLLPIRGGLGLSIELVRYMLTHGRPTALVVRYLNDRSTFIKSLLYTLGLSASLVLCKLTNVHIIWFCHNVDRETRTFHPRLTSFRRNLTLHFSAQIFLTDPLLNECYSQLFPHTQRHKLNWITFGRPLPTHQPSEPKVEQQIRDFALSFRRQSQEEYRSPLIGLCLGDAGPKYAHFDFALSLLQQATRTPFKVGLVVGGNVWATATEQQRIALQSLRSRQDVLFFPRYVQVDELRLRDCIDFIWRGYRDVSMSYSLYVAAAAELPILTLNMGFVSTAVKKYRLGATIDTDFSNLNEPLEKLISWDPSAARRFLQTHTWECGTHRLFSSLEALSRHRP